MKQPLKCLSWNTQVQQTRELKEIKTVHEGTMVNMAPECH